MRRKASVPRVELGSLDQAARPVPEKRREAHHRERYLHEPQPSARGGRALLRIASELAGVQHLSSSKRCKLQEPTEGRQVRDLRKVPHVSLEVRLYEPAEPQGAIANLSQRDRRETSCQHVLRTKWRRRSARGPPPPGKRGGGSRGIPTPPELPQRGGGDRRETSCQHVLRTKWRRSSAREPRLREKGGEERSVIRTPAKLPKREGAKREVDGPARQRLAHAFEQGQVGRPGEQESTGSPVPRRPASRRPATRARAGPRRFVSGSSPARNRRFQLGEVVERRVPAPGKAL